MLNFFKKKEPPPVAIPPPKVFEPGKEITFRDEKTGMFISQRPLNEEQRKAYFAKIQENAGLANQFIIDSRNFIAHFRRLNDCFDKIDASEKQIREVVNKILDEEKLDKRWDVNPQLGVLQKTDPPTP